MSDVALTARDLGREAFGTSCGLAVVAGALTAVVPGFATVTVPLVALALAAWASVHRRAGGGFVPVRTAPTSHTVAFGVLVLGAVLFVEPPPALLPWRALLLGLGVVPLWVVDHRRPRAGVPAPGRG